jgi:hypothetical protein
VALSCRVLRVFEELGLERQSQSPANLNVQIQIPRTREATRQRQCDVPLLRHLSREVLQVEEALRGARGRRPSGPADQAHKSPNATPAAVVSKVLYLRQNYHFGAGRIRDYLKRFHDVRIAGATVQSLLHKHGLGRLPASQKHQPHGKRWIRYEKPIPGHRIQMDVKFLERIAGSKKRLYQFTAIDDCTRIRVLKIYDACNQATAVNFVDEVLRRLPFRVHVTSSMSSSVRGRRV